MPRKCSLCIHPSRSEIEQSFLSDDSYRTIAQQFGVSRDAVARHRRHLARTLAKATDAKELTQADTLIAHLRDLTSEAQRLKEKAELAGDFRTALAAVRELCRIVELVAKLRGELDERAEIKVINFNVDAETAKRISDTFLARHQLRVPSP